MCRVSYNSGHLGFWEEELPAAAGDDSDGNYHCVPVSPAQPHQDHGAGSWGAPALTTVTSTPASSRLRSSCVASHTFLQTHSSLAARLHGFKINF